VTEIPLKNSFRNDLQGLRGVAIVSVLLFHLPNTFFHQGYLGVDIFFVISGFLITPRIIQIFENAPNNSVVKK
jgi:peptidoglycan/LPS O-acetylase OafA/YrhL